MSKDQGGHYICQKERTLVFTRIVPCCPYCVPVISSLATFTVIISLDHQFVLPACLSLWDAHCIWSPLCSVSFFFSEMGRGLSKHNCRSIVFIGLTMTTCFGRAWTSSGHKLVYK